MADIAFLNPSPVRFDFIDDSCLDCDDRDFCQKVQFNDPLLFLFSPSTTAVAVANSTFTGGLTSWTAGAGWTASGNKALITLDTGDLSQTLSITAGHRYKITFTLSSVTAAGEFQCNLGNYVHNLTASNGTFSFYAYPTSGTDIVFFTVSGDVVALLDNIIVEDISTDYTLKAVSSDGQLNFSSTIAAPNLSSLQNEYIGFNKTWSDFNIVVEGCYELHLTDVTTGLVHISECYNLKTIQPDTYLFVYHNNLHDAFDIPYSLYTTLVMRFYLRLSADIRNSSYKGEASKYRDSGNNTWQYYGNGRKLKEIIFGMAPEYIHDAISIMILHSNIYISELNKERFVFEESDYTPEWKPDIKLRLAESRMLIGRYNGK